MPISTETFRSGHSLIMGNRPLIAEEKGLMDIQKHLEEKSDHKLESFGFWDTSSPNFNTYYPDVTPEDLAPKDEDYVYPMYRALSEVLVRPFAPIDFGIGTVLKDSMHLLVGQAVYPNHEMVSGDELGTILKAEWQAAKKVKLESGETLNVPAGINVTLKIDGKANPKQARGMMADPPSVHSVSVTVQFEWEPSHPQMDRGDFMSKLGTYDENGKLIKRNVTKVISFQEISTVPHGADPFAQRIDSNGNIVNPDHAAAVYSFSAAGDKEYANIENGDKLVLPFDFKTLTAESLSADTTIPKNNNTQTEKPKNNILMDINFLKGFLGQDAENLSDEEIVAKAKEMLMGSKTNLEELARLKTVEENLTSEVADLKEKLTAAEGFQATAEDATTHLRNEATRLATLSNDGTIEESMTSLIAAADYKGLQALVAQFSKSVKEKFGNDGGTVENPDGDDADQDTSSNADKDKKKPTESLADFGESFRQEKLKPSTAVLHGESKAAE